MPLENINAFFGAAVLGVITACGVYIFERYRQQKNQVAMARDLARLDNELRQVKQDLETLTKHKLEKDVKSKKNKSVAKTYSVISNSTNDDYLSASNLDSSDLEFYDISDHESDTIEEGDHSLESILEEISFVLDSQSLPQVKNALERLHDLLIDYPNNPEILWRIGKAHHKIAEEFEDKDIKNDNITKGINACTKALEINPNNADIHKWFAILVGSRSEIVSTKDRISDGHLFKKHVDAALAINPYDASLHHLLGRFDYELSSLKWYEKKVASTLFAELPQATIEDALKHFMDAEKLTNFDWKENKLMIAKCKISMKEYTEAVDWLQKATNCKQVNGGDDKIDIEIKMLLDMYSNYR